MFFHILFVFCLLKTSEASDWSYEGPHGLFHWREEYPDCGKHHQSPIDVPAPSNLKLDSSLQDMTFNGFSSTQMYNLELLNNGHTAVVKVFSSDVGVNGTGLPGGGLFKTEQFHFHWGENSQHGSEHLINGNTYPLEAHIVNYNSNYDSIKEAVKKKDGLAVVAVLFEVSPEDNENLAPLINALENVKYRGQKYSIEDFKISSLLPENSNCFYRYTGSLTTPGCFESVTWTIFSQFQKISGNQLAKFRALYKDKTGIEKIGFNNRPPQDLHGRKVSTSCHL